MKPRLWVAVGVMVAASCASTPKGAVIMPRNPEGPTAQDDSQAFMMRPLRIADAPTIDRLKLVETAGQLTLLYSTQNSSQPENFDLVIHAAPVSDITRPTEIARIAQTLPSPGWDARPVGDSYEVLYELAGGAVSAILFRSAQGNTTRVSVEHPFEDFGRAHFVHAGTNVDTPDVGAVANLTKLVVFPGGTTQPVKYVALTDGADGIVGGAAERWVVAKGVMSGDALFGTLPGRLTLSRVGVTDTRSSVPDLLVYELDAAPLANDIVVFVTSKPAVLIRGQRASQPYRLSAENRSWLLQLSRPTVLVTSQFVHLAAIVSPRTEQAFILYGAVPIGSLAQ